MRGMSALDERVPSASISAEVCSADRNKPGDLLISSRYGYCADKAVDFRNKLRTHTSRLIDTRYTRVVQCCSKRRKV